MVQEREQQQAAAEVAVEAAVRAAAVVAAVQEAVVAVHEAVVAAQAAMVVVVVTTSLVLVQCQAVTPTNFQRSLERGLPPLPQLRHMHSAQLPQSQASRLLLARGQDRRRRQSAIFVIRIATRLVCCHNTCLTPTLPV